MNKLVGIMLATVLSISLYGKKSYKEISSLDEYKQILKSSRPAIINYHMPTCDACTQMEPCYDKVAAKYRNKADFYAVNVSEKDFKSLIKEHKIEGLPTTTFHKDAKEVRRERGSMGQEEADQVVNQFINGPSGFIVEKQQEAKEAKPAKQSTKIAKK